MSQHFCPKMLLIWIWVSTVWPAKNSNYIILHRRKKGGWGAVGVMARKSRQNSPML